MIREYIVSYLLAKFKDSQALVMYDHDHRYVELLPVLKEYSIEVFDVSTDVLSTREDALDYFSLNLPKNNNARMLVYIPFAAPNTRQEMIDDPFILFSFGEKYFPFDANDKYESLCKACFKDKEDKIDELFANEIPDFDTIDALGQGNIWAKLQTITGSKSETEILLSIMAPSTGLIEKLRKEKSWQKEFRDFCKQFGLKIPTNVFDEIRHDVWRFILFSEFVFDLPIELPQSLKSVPTAKDKYRVLVLGICKSLRNNKAYEDVYIEMADKVSNELSLSSVFKNENNLGNIITFSFEDNTYFFQFASKLLIGKYDEAENIIANIKENIWLHHDKERRRYWKLADLSYQIIKFVDEANPSCASLRSLIDLYSSELYKIDQLQRKLEKEYLEILQPNDILLQLVNFVRVAYNEFTERIQKKYQLHIAHENWPPSDILKNTDVFAKYIQTALKSRDRTAYILVDALRYELGKELENQLEKHFNIQVVASCAYLPTVTKFGMAALLPESDKLLHLETFQGSLESYMGEKLLLNLGQRKDYLKEKLGDRCQIKTLDNLISGSSVDEADLLVITTNEIDTAGENLASNSLHAIHQAVQNLVKGIYLLSQAGYKKIVVATDHGFVLHPVFQPGDSLGKPPGEWVMSKSRSLAGQGASPETTLAFSPQQLGIKSNVTNFVFLKGYTVFERNTTYFHEGLSLQENIVPVIILSKLDVKEEEHFVINLTYKGKSSGIITSRRPSVEVASYMEGKLGLYPITIRMEAIAEDKIVGLPSSDEKVNETTKLVEIIPEHSYKIALDMETDFEGQFEVRITDPVTNKLYSSITLKTDYIS